MVQNNCCLWGVDLGSRRQEEKLFLILSPSIFLKFLFLCASITPMIRIKWRLFIYKEVSTILGNDKHYLQNIFCVPVFTSLNKILSDYLQITLSPDHDRRFITIKKSKRKKRMLEFVCSIGLGLYGHLFFLSNL